MKKLILPLVVLLITQGCSIEKRQYLGGYHISKRGNLTVHKATETSKTSASTGTEKPDLLFLTPKTTNEPIGLETHEPETLENTCAKANDSETTAVRTPKPNKVLPKPTTSLKIKLSASRKATAFHLGRVNEKSAAEEDLPFWVIVLFCFIIPPLAVGFATNWQFEPVLINFLLCLIFWIPGVIHALYVVLGKGK